jgi:hypothetical protein
VASIASKNPMTASLINEPSHGRRLTVFEGEEPPDTL